MKRLRRYFAPVATFVGRCFAELRDAWAITLAEITGGVTYLVGAPLWLSLASASSVLGVRIAAGLALPRQLPVEKERKLSQFEEDVAKMIAGGQSSADIARQLKDTANGVRALRQRIFVTLGITHRWELRAWLEAEGIIRPVRRSAIRGFIESDLVRATLTAGGFIGLSWTLFQIFRFTCAGLRLTLPWLPPCPP